MIDHLVSSLLLEVATDFDDFVAIDDQTEVSRIRTPEVVQLRSRDDQRSGSGWRRHGVILEHGRVDPDVKA